MLAEDGGWLGEHKGINAPNVPLPAVGVTAKDEDDVLMQLDEAEGKGPRRPVTTRKATAARMCFNPSATWPRSFAAIERPGRGAMS